MIRLAPKTTDGHSMEIPHRGLCMLPVIQANIIAK